MLPALGTRIDPQRLFRRLGWLRWRIRATATLTGVCLMAAILIGGAALAGWIDWWLQLPELVRALALVGLLCAAGWIAWKQLLSPILKPAGNFDLALQIERRHPHLNDALASAVQFLGQPPEDDSVSSPLLRRIAVRHAMREADRCNFDGLVNRRGLIRSIAACAVALAAALPPLLVAPHLARTALFRLLAPFGANIFPAKTTIRMIQPDAFPHRTAVGESLEIHAEVGGTVPDRGTLQIWVDGSAVAEQTWAIETVEPAKGRWITRIEPSRVQRNMKIRLKANDADTGWLEVLVLPPPELAPLGGRPSPQIRLEFPAYTDLKPRQLPDGASSWEAVAGTNVTLRAATNRPVARGWIVYSPENPANRWASALAPLAGTRPFESLAAFATSRAIYAPVPLAISGDGMQFEATFTPRLAGTYALRFEDATSFGATRLLDIAVLPDPAPAVNLERPSASFDSLTVTPIAELSLKAEVADAMFAIRTIAMEYTTRKDDSPRRLSYYHHEVMGRAWPALLTRFGGSIIGPKPLRLRPKQLHIDDRLRLAAFKHLDGQPLREGDVLTIQMLADDFDDVTLAKAPGRSHKVELYIVSPQTLEAMLQREQSRVRQELLKLQQWQRDARSKVSDAIEQREATGQLRPEDRERLLQAEQLQSQIRSRVGTERDGLRAEVNRLRQAMQDNKLPPSPSQDRVATVANELARLAREELAPIEPLLNSARENPAPADEKNEGKVKKDPLAEAERHQNEVEKTLDALLQRLEPWSGANEVRGETRSLLDELQRLQNQTKELIEKLPTGADRERLPPQDKADLDKTAIRQENVARQADQLLDKIERLAGDKERQAREREQEANKLQAGAKEMERKADANSNAQEQAKQRRAAQRLREQAQEHQDAAAGFQQEAATLRQAAKSGKESLQSKSGSPESQNQTRLDDAARAIRENRLGTAQENQQRSAEALRDMLARLEERREDELDRLQRKMRQTQEKLDDLADRQERLQKKVREAEKIADPQKRQQELERLAREQEKLRQEARDLAQELSRLQAGDAAKSLSRAAREMGDARQRLERGERADESQDGAVERIDQAQDQLEKSREQVEDELMREKIVKISKRIEAIRDRQKRAMDESRRLHDDAVAAKKWERDKVASLVSLRDNEESLADELEGLIDKRFREQKVIAKMLDHTTDAMRQAAAQIDERVQDINNRLDEEPFDPALEERMQAAILLGQRTALRRLDQFLEAIKPDKELAQSAREAAGKKQGDGAGSGRAGESDALPPLAELRALRMLQAEVNERTEKFAKEHPDPAKLNEADQAELDALAKLQRDIAVLIQELPPASGPEGEQP